MFVSTRSFSYHIFAKAKKVAVKTTLQLNSDTKGILSLISEVGDIHKRYFSTTASNILVVQQKYKHVTVLEQ